MTLLPGQPVTPARLRTLDFDSVTTAALTVAPVASSSSLHVTLNQNYKVYADNAGAGSDNSRVWLDGPNGGEAIIGPRGGLDFFGSIRLKTNATTASAANCFIDSSNQTIRRSTSSLRYKVDVETAALDTELLLQLRPVTFRDRGEAEEHGEGTRRYLGLIAEEVHELGLTQLVQYQTDPDAPDSGERPDGVQYDRLTVALLGIVKDLSARVAELEADAGRPRPAHRRG